MRTFILFSSLAALTSVVSAADWSQWRGPERDGVSRETGLLQSWPQGGPKLAWHLKGLGKGMSSVSIANGRIFTMGSRKDGQMIIACDASTQKEVWAAKVSKHGGEPRCTPTVAGGLGHALSDDGEVLCCSEVEGKEVWRKSFEEDFGNPPKPG